jgi:hypothetical protein
VPSRHDPRIAAAQVTSGPSDLVGKRLVVVDHVVVEGETIHVPRPLAGVAEFVAVARSEQQAEQLRANLLATLEDRGEYRSQPDERLVVEMRSAAEAAVTGATVGLEAFANHHLEGAAAANGGLVSIEGDTLSPQEWRERYSLDERYKIVLPALLDRPKPTSEPWWPKLRRVQGLAALTRHAIMTPVKRSGLTGERPLAERYYNGEYVGAAAMLLDVFDYFVPNWIDDADLRALPGTGPPTCPSALIRHSSRVARRSAVQTWPRRDPGRPPRSPLDQVHSRDAERDGAVIVLASIVVETQPRGCLD